MYDKIISWVKLWRTRGYQYDIPDEAPEVFERENKVPSYRRICLAIMKNDCQLQTLGYNRVECQSYQEIKRAELSLIKNKHIRSLQMRLFR